MIYGLYWKTTGKRYHSNTTSLLFATKKGADSYIKNQKSLGLNKSLVSKVFTGKVLYTLVYKPEYIDTYSTLEKDIAKEDVIQSCNGVMGVARLGIKMSRPKEMFALVERPYARIMFVHTNKRMAVIHKNLLQTTGNDYKIIKIK